MTDHRQFWAWSSSTPTAPDYLLRQGAGEFAKKHGRWPTMALVHPTFLAKVTNPLDGLRLEACQTVQRRHVWFLLESE